MNLNIQIMPRENYTNFVRFIVNSKLIFWNVWATILEIIKVTFESNYGRQKWVWSSRRSRIFLDSAARIAGSTHASSASTSMPMSSSTISLLGWIRWSSKLLIVNVFFWGFWHLMGFLQLLWTFCSFVYVIYCGLLWIMVQ